MAVRAEPVAWNGDLVTAGRTQALAENSASTQQQLNPIKFPTPVRLSHFIKEPAAQHY